MPVFFGKRYSLIPAIIKERDRGKNWRKFVGKHPIPKKALIEILRCYFVYKITVFLFHTKIRKIIDFHNPQPQPPLQDLRQLRLTFNVQRGHQVLNLRMIVAQGLPGGVLQLIAQGEITDNIQKPLYMILDILNLHECVYDRGHFRTTLLVLGHCREFCCVYDLFDRLHNAFHSQIAIKTAPLPQMHLQLQAGREVAAAVELRLESELGIRITRTCASLGERQSILKADVDIIYADVKASLQSILLGVAVLVDKSLTISRIQLHLKIETTQPPFPTGKNLFLESIGIRINVRLIAREHIPEIIGNTWIIPAQCQTSVDKYL